MWRTRDQAHVMKQRMIRSLPIRLGTHACMRAATHWFYPRLAARCAVKNLSSAQYTHSSFIARRGVSDALTFLYVSESGSWSIFMAQEGGIITTRRS